MKQPIREIEQLKARLTRCLIGDSVCSWSMTHEECVAMREDLPMVPDEALASVLGKVLVDFLNDTTDTRNMFLLFIYLDAKDDRSDTDKARLARLTGDPLLIEGALRGPQSPNWWAITEKRALFKSLSQEQAACIYDVLRFIRECVPPDIQIDESALLAALRCWRELVE